MKGSRITVGNLYIEVLISKEKTNINQSLLKTFLKLRILLNNFKNLGLFA